MAGERKVDGRMTVHDVARRLGVGEGTVRKMRSRGTFPAATESHA